MKQRKNHHSTYAEMHWKTEDVLKDDSQRESAPKIELLKRPYDLALKNEWDDLKTYYVGKPQELNRPMTLDKDTALHIVASSCSKSQVLELLINLLPPSYDERCEALRHSNNHGNNVLHEVAASGNLEAAEFLVSKFNNPPRSSDDENCTLPLLQLRNNLGESPVYRAAAFGHTKLVQFFAHKLQEESPETLRRHFLRNNKKSILHIAVIGQHFETALWLQRNHSFLAPKREGTGVTSFQLVAQMPTAFDPEFQQSKWKMIIYHCLPVGDLVTPNHKDDVESSLGSESDQPPQSICRKTHAVILNVYASMWNFLAKEIDIIDKIWKDKKNKNSLKELVHLFVKEDHSWQNSKPAKHKTPNLGSVVENVCNQDEDKKVNGSAEPNKSKKLHLDTYTPLLMATITGIVPIVEEILEQRPQAVEHLSPNEQNILHLAIKHRRIEILDLLKSKPTIISRLKERIDSEGNSILHQAADRSYYTVAMSQKLIGPAMQLQEELRWMLRVKEMVPRHYIIHRNQANQTAEELFNDQHNGLLEKAQQWIKGTAESCSTVAVLVATVVFAAAYALPGGTEPNGLPVFHDSPLFGLFTYMDVVAIACSLSSVAFFLSILSSPLEYPFFCHSIPRKLMIGFTLLFLSMATTMLAFAATILLVIRIEKKWTKSVLYSIAFFPVPLFGLLQFPMFKSFKDIYRKITKIFRPFSKRRSICGKSNAD